MEALIKTTPNEHDFGIHSIDYTVQERSRNHRKIFLKHRRMSCLTMYESN